MARTARGKSRTRIYHVMLRGINRQAIFEDNEDYRKFFWTIKDTKEKGGYKVYAYCFMSNHVHLLIKEGQRFYQEHFRCQKLNGNSMV